MAASGRWVVACYCGGVLLWACYCGVESGNVAYTAGSIVFRTYLGAQARVLLSRDWFPGDEDVTLSGSGALNALHVNGCPRAARRVVAFTGAVIPGRGEVALLWCGEWDFRRQFGPVI